MYGNSPRLPQYRVEVLLSGRNRWATNQRGFDSRVAAQVYERGLYARWFRVDKMRVVPVTHPRDEEYEPGSEDYDGI